MLTVAGGGETVEKEEAAETQVEPKVVGQPIGSGRQGSGFGEGGESGKGRVRGEALGRGEEAEQGGAAVAA